MGTNLYQKKRVMASSKATLQKTNWNENPHAAPHTGNQETPQAPPLKALKKRGCRNVRSTARHPASIASPNQSQSRNEPIEEIKESKRRRKMKMKKRTQTSKYPFRINERRTSTREMHWTTIGKKDAINAEALKNTKIQIPFRPCNDIPPMTKPKRTEKRHVECRWRDELESRQG